MLEVPDAIALIAITGLGRGSGFPQPRSVDVEIFATASEGARSPNMVSVIRRKTLPVEQEPELVEGVVPSQNLLQIGDQAHDVG